MPWVYIIRCADGSYYVGNTLKTVEERFAEHVDGLYRGYTSVRRPLELVYVGFFETLTDTFKRERQIKGWSRKKKEALLAQRPQDLPDLSRRMSVQRRLGIAPPRHTLDAPHPEARAQRASKD